MAHLISIEVRNILYTDTTEFSDAEVEITTPMNLSEEFAITAAQHALTTELGCDLALVQTWEADATNEAGAWFVTFRSPDYSDYSD